MSQTNDIEIGPGCRVCLHFSIAAEDGTVMDSTDPEDPAYLNIGDGTLVEGLEACILGLRAGARQTVQLEPREAFGFADEGLVHTLSRSDFPEDMPLEEGLLIGFSTPAGEEIPGTILLASEEAVVVDFNHPLAGHTVTFECEILSVEAAALH